MAKKILVVEDEEPIANAYSELFRLEGYETVKATEPLRVYDAVKEHKPDLILLDLMMNYLDGYDQVQLLKMDPETKHIPIVVITAKAPAQIDMQQFQALGVTEFFFKPPNIDKLTASVAALIGK
ncbi:MAG TPA: response regulator [Ktedonobacterales bacterium]